MLAGGCHCRRLRYETDGAPFNATICHCVDCRRVSGASSVAWFTVRRASVRWIGEPAGYSSSPGVVRRFCIACGTSLSFEDERHADEIDLATASLDDPDQVPPQDHVFASQHPAWDLAEDGLPSYARGRDDAGAWLPELDSNQRPSD